MRTITAFVVLLAGTVAMIGGSSSAAASTRCPSRGTTVDRSAQVRLYYRGSNVDHVVYACVVETGRVRRLGAYVFNTGGVGTPTLAGRYVAWDDFDCNSRDGCAGGLVVKDVVTNHRLLQSPNLQDGIAVRISLTSRGRVSYTRASYEQRFVWAFDRRGAAKLLDSGPNVDATSLAFNGHRVYWINGGQPRTAVAAP